MILLFMYAVGFSKEYLTPACAAKWKTISGLNFEIDKERAFLSSNFFFQKKSWGIFLSFQFFYFLN